MNELDGLTTPHLADACLRDRIELRLAPQGLRPVVPGTSARGNAVPVRHFGSVDIFIEAIATATPGSVLVIDDGGRDDQACIGDLIVGEAKLAGLAGIVVWGRHRDTGDIQKIGLPVFSLGAFPAGPQSAVERDPDAFASARVGQSLVDAGDVVLADDDGAVFLSADQVAGIAATARSIRDREVEQAARLERGSSLYAQFDYGEFLRRRAEDPSYTLRAHLQAVGRAIET